VTIDRAKAADLHVSVSDIAATLETMLGSRQVTDFQRGNQQYYVILQIEDQKRVTPSDLARLYVRSTTGHLVQLSNLVDGGGERRAGELPALQPPAFAVGFGATRGGLDDRRCRGVSRARGPCGAAAGLLLRVGW
jgi:hypothetical protein